MLNILQDFYNLVDVYLDAVFFPKCVEDFQTFQQEGWHYELNNPEEDISYKGCLLDLLSVINVFISYQQLIFCLLKELKYAPVSSMLWKL